VPAGQAASGQLVGKKPWRIKASSLLHQTKAFRRHGLQVLAPSPLVLDGVLDLCHPSPAVITEPPSRLEARPPVAVLLHLDRPRWVEALLLQESDRDGHGDDLPRRRPYVAHPFE
jgi:hypothetical protein